jgi:tetratricopeptide (TPR) repeat protein
VLCAAAPGLAQADDFAAFGKGRAAEGDGKASVAAAQYGIALEASPANSRVAQRAWREAMAAGDLALARRAVAALVSNKEAPPIDAAVLGVADAVHSGNPAALNSAIAALAKSPYAFLGPIVRAWVSLGTAPDPAGTLIAPKEGVVRNLINENRALLLIADNRVNDGVDALQAALAGSNSDLDLRYTAAELLAGKGKTEIALALLRGDEPAVAYFRARFSPVTATPAYGISRLFTRLAANLDDDRMAPAMITLCRSALLVDPSNDRARVLLATALTRTGANGQAIIALDEIAPHSPFKLMAETIRVSVLTAEGNNEGALAVAKALNDARGADDQVARSYGDLLMNADRPAEAAIAYTTARDRQGAKTDWRIWFQIGSAQDRAGKWSQARASLERSLELGPAQAIALNYYGYALAERGEDLDRAQSMLEKANALAPDQPSITDSLGWVYYCRGYTARALPLLERAAQDSPASSDIADHLGDVYWSVGRRYEARYAWRAALIVADEKHKARIADKIANGLPSKPL